MAKVKAITTINEILLLCLVIVFLLLGITVGHAEEVADKFDPFLFWITIGAGLGVLPSNPLSGALSVGGSFTWQLGKNLFSFSTGNKKIPINH